MDYNPAYIELARQQWPPAEYPNLEFHVGNIIDLGQGSPIFRERRLNVEILIDTFLFLFDPSYQKELYNHRRTIMANLRNLLKPGGQLLVMDPHPFWLTPWIGRENRCAGILTEYRRRHFKVSPRWKSSPRWSTRAAYGFAACWSRTSTPSMPRSIRAATPSCRSFRNGGFGNWKTRNDAIGGLSCTNTNRQGLGVTLTARSAGPRPCWRPRR